MDRMKGGAVKDDRSPLNDAIDWSYHYRQHVWTEDNQAAAANGHWTEKPKIAHGVYLYEGKEVFLEAIRQIARSLIVPSLGYCRCRHRRPSFVRAGLSNITHFGSPSFFGLTRLSYSVIAFGRYDCEWIAGMLDNEY